MCSVATRSLGSLRPVWEWRNMVTLGLLSDPCLTMWMVVSNHRSGRLVCIISHWIFLSCLQEAAQRAEAIHDLPISLNIGSYYKHKIFHCENLIWSAPMELSFIYFFQPVLKPESHKLEFSKIDHLQVSVLMKVLCRCHDKGSSEQSSCFYSWQ